MPTWKTQKWEEKWKTKTINRFVVCATNTSAISWWQGEKGASKSTSMAKVENTFKSLIFRPCASPSSAFLLATVLRELLILQSRKLPSDSSELLPTLLSGACFSNYPLYCGFLLSISSSSLHPLSFQLRQIFIQFHFLPHQNQLSSELWKPESGISNKIKYTPNTGYELCLHYKWTSSMFTTCKCILFHQFFHFHL